MEAYSILAKYYDKLMKDFDYDKYLNFIKGFISGEGIDLCCGTGKMTIAIKKMGAKVIGVDLSDEMLNVARDEARCMAQNIMFISSSCIDFIPPHKVDFVTAICDGFNYIDEKDLKTTISNISSYLKKDGYLIFDISSSYKLENVLGDNTFCEDLDDLTYIWSNEKKDNYIDMDLAFFTPQSKDLYKRVDENQRQYIHSLDEVKKMLSDDFAFDIYDGSTFSNVKEDSQRLLFIARRK